MTEENMGISRVQSSLELLSYTASLKNEIDKVQGDFPPARVSPAGRNILVHHMDAGGMASNAASSTAIAHGPSYSIEGYPLSTLEKSASYEEASSIGSPVPYFGHDNNRSAFEARRPTLAIKQPESSLSLSSLASGHHFGSANGFMRREETFASLQDLTSRISPSTDSLVVDAVSRATGSTKAYAQLEAENAELRQLLADKEEVIASLQDTVDSLQHKVADLRQLPTGKISQIPIEDMLSIMREYGSEVSEHAAPPRKDNVQKASVVRQFRRWNPNFFQFFYHKDGKWVPKLGKKGELNRRAEMRKMSRSKAGKGNVRP